MTGTLVATPRLLLNRSKVTRAKWGTYTTYSSVGTLTGPNGQQWRLSADNAGGGAYGGHLSLMDVFDDGRRYACGQSGISLGPVQGGRGIADRLAAAALDALATAVHVKAACPVCTKEPQYAVQWDSARSETSRGYYFVKDTATGEKVVEGLENAQAAHRWLAERGHQ